MSEFEEGVYVITNTLCHTNAALVSDDDNEPVRGITPGSVDDISEDIDKVSPALSLELLTANSICIL